MRGRSFIIVVQLERRDVFYSLNVRVEWRRARALQRAVRTSSQFLFDLLPSIQVHGEISVRVRVPI